ncbi:DsbA family protein [Pseudoalteromonas phenolica]|nr:DsbA family protein [Pseudoalteromonas phenolica]
MIAAEALSPNSAEIMVKAIQLAYYQKAQNPSLQQTLVECALSIGLDGAEFEKVLLSAETESQLQQHLGLVQQLRVSGFPALFYVNENNEAFALALGFCEVGDLEERFDKCKKHIA